MAILLPPILLTLPYLIYAFRGGMPSMLPSHLAVLFPILLAASALLRAPRFRNALATRPYAWVWGLTAAIFVTGFLLGRLWNPLATAPEMHNFYREFLNAAQGGFFIHPSEHRSEFAIHFSPVLFLVLPLFKLAPSPSTLFFVGSLVLSLSLPLCHRYLKTFWPPASAALLSSGAVLFPSILSQHIDFSPVRFAPLAIWSLLLAYREQNRRWLVLAILACWMVKETLLLAVIMLAVVALLEKRGAFWVLVPGVSGIVLFLVTNQWIIPAFAGTAGKTSTIAAQFGYWGQNPVEVLRGFASHPGSVLASLLRLNNMAYLLKLGHGVLWILPLLSPLTLIALPEMMVNMMAGYNPPLQDPSHFGPWTSLNGHYSVTIGVVLWAAASNALCLKRRSATGITSAAAVAPGGRSEEDAAWNRACWLFLAVLSTVIYPTNSESL